MSPDDRERLKQAYAALERDRARADAIAEDLVRRNPDAPEARIAWAASRSRLQDYAAAVRQLDIASCVTDSSLLRFNLGYCHRQTGDYERAAAHLRRGLAMPGADETLRALTVNTLDILGRRDEARRVLGIAETPITKFCSWLLGETTAAAAREYFSAEPARADHAVLFWMKYDCHLFGELDDKASLARLLGSSLDPYWPTALVVPDDLAQAKKDDSWWLFKPSALSGGQGMRLTRDPRSLERSTRGIAQRYVHPPLLVEGRKFNLRLLWCLRSVDPLRAYLWRDGLVFISPEPHVEPAEGEAGIAHVVNLLRAKPEDIPRPVGQFPAHIVPLSQLLEVMDLQPGITALGNALVGALEANGFLERVRKAGDPKAFPPRFVGLDVGFGEDLAPRLFEIERYPGIGGVSKQSAEINARFRRQWMAFVLADDPASDPNFLPLAG